MSAFHLACENGHSKTVEIFMQKSTELKIDLNAKESVDGKTAFQLACEDGHTNVVKMIIQKSDEVDIDLRLEMA